MRCGDALNDVISDVFGARAPEAVAYREILATTGIEWGLLGPREAGRLWERHIFNSAAMASLVPEGSHVVDVGSGAGLPGIPLALARPDLRITLLEPLLRRITFLHEVVDNLGISENVDILRGRAEEIDESFDVVTGRAVGPMKRLLPWVNGLMARPQGQAILLKGGSADAELQAVEKSLAKMRLDAEICSVRAHPRSEPTTVVRLRRG